MSSIPCVILTITVRGLQAYIGSMVEISIDSIETVLHKEYTVARRNIDLVPGAPVSVLKA